MLLLIDITNSRSRVALLGVRSARPRPSQGKAAGVWRSADSRDAVPRLLAALKRSRALPAKGASGVIALVSRPRSARDASSDTTRDASSDTTRDASWSAIRAAVATANALAFAWGVPAATLAVTGDETESALETAATAAAKSLRRGSRASAAYDGEPNITQPKPAQP